MHEKYSSSSEAPFTVYILETDMVMGRGKKNKPNQIPHLTYKAFQKPDLLNSLANAMDQMGWDSPYKCIHHASYSTTPIYPNIPLISLVHHARLLKCNPLGAVTATYYNKYTFVQILL